MEELLASTGYNIPSLRRGQEVTGKVVAVSPSEILVDIGGKSEGILTGQELSAVRDIASKLSVGDTLDVTILYPENDAGQIVLSLRKLSGERRWTELEEKRLSQEDLEVSAVEANRGGIICDFFGIRGFLPASQLLQPVKANELIGRALTARVIEVDKQTNRLIFSQKQSSQKDFKEIAKLLAEVEIGQKLKGVVTAALPFGIFVEVEVEESKSPADAPSTSLRALAGRQRVKESEDKLEGLVHISEISWEKVDDPKRLFKVGDKVEVMVIAKDETTGRLNLSVKQLAKDPFLESSGKYSKDETVEGTVARVSPYGVFVLLDEGIEGLMHISKIPPNQAFDIGQKVTCTIESVDTEARRISLAPVVKEKPILYR